jgi:hypothetical protein
VRRTADRKTDKTSIRNAKRKEYSVYFEENVAFDEDEDSNWSTESREKK